MRNLIFAINTTLDGSCDHTKQMADEESLHYFANLLREADLQIFGRITYQLMVPYWPEVAKSQSASPSANEFARVFDSLPRVVFSRSLERTDDPKARIVRTDLREEILKLKQQPGKNILVGGVNVSSQLIELDLVDEFLFVVQPIIAGEGARLLRGVPLPQKLQLKLVESRFFQSGCAALRYRKS